MEKTQNNKAWFLVLPVLVGALWLALSNGPAPGGTVLLAAGAAGLAWYLLGGAISARPKPPTAKVWPSFTISRNAASAFS